MYANEPERSPPAHSAYRFIRSYFWKLQPSAARSADTGAPRKKVVISSSFLVESMPENCSGYTQLPTW